MRKKIYKKHVILNSFQDLISERPCDPEINSGQHRFAFTLAEVLITLAVVGVVAAITIPIVMANYQKTQYVTQLKKAYTEFNQALVQMAADKGCVGDLKCTGVFADDKTNQDLGNELVKYFKVVKNCESDDGGPTITGCFSDKVSFNYDGSGTRQDWDETEYYRFITSDGMAMKIYNYKVNCEDSGSLGITNNMTQLCGEIIIDVNGLKGPNNAGRDIFSFYIANGKGPLLYPWGGADDGLNGPWRDNDGNTQYCYPSSKWGTPCTGRLIEEGWQMNY